jgi:hypothetical protein
MHLSDVRGEVLCRIVSRNVAHVSQLCIDPSYVRQQEKMTPVQEGLDASAGRTSPPH